MHATENPSELNAEELAKVMTISSVEGNMVTLVPVLVIICLQHMTTAQCSRTSQMTPYWKDEHARRVITSCIRALGSNLATEVILDV